MSTCQFRTSHGRACRRDPGDCARSADIRCSRSACMNALLRLLKGIWEALYFLYVYISTAVVQSSAPPNPDSGLCIAKACFASVLPIFRRSCALLSPPGLPGE
jgi:hypothetical protein